MEETALESRPELIEASYNERIDLDEAHKALVKLLPGIDFSAGTHYDSNSFLTYSSWQDAGAHVVGNLFNVLNLKNIRGLNDTQIDLAHKQHLAVTMAVLTQVHVAGEDLASMRRQFDLAKQIDDVDEQILEHTRNAAQADAQGRLAEIEAATTAMMSELRLYQTYGALENAYGQLLASIGLDPIPAETPDGDLSSVAKTLAGEEQHWTGAGQSAVAQK
jgi:outer membrane protein TolC